MRVHWAVLVAVCLVVVTAAVAYTAGKRSAPEVIRAQQFELVDARGRMRASLEMCADGPALLLYDGNRELRARLGADDDRPSLMLSDEKMVRAELGIITGEPTLVLSDENGEPRAVVISQADGPRILFRDDRGEIRAGLGVDAEGPVLGLRDENGRMRAALGATSPEVTLAPRVEKRAESSLVLFDEGGTVMWEAP
jgi:hypothetical protein